MSDTYAHRQDREPKTKRFKKRFYRIGLRCSDKGVWPDEITARVGGMLSIEERRNIAQLRVYPCPHCKRWHLTSQDRGPRWAVLLPEKRKAA